jgi:hypothetical protein
LSYSLWMGFRCRSETHLRRLLNPGSKSQPFSTVAKGRFGGGKRHEGLPVHRRGHQKNDTVFAFRHEIQAWTRRRTKFAETGATNSRENQLLSHVNTPANSYLVEYDAITRTMERYIAGAREGDGELLRPAFHPQATISGYCQGSEYSDSVEHVFEWITANGPAPSIEP